MNFFSILNSISQLLSKFVNLDKKSCHLEYEFLTYQRPKYKLKKRFFPQKLTTRLIDLLITKIAKLFCISAYVLENSKKIYCSDS